jgi:hypothetical protein
MRLRMARNRDATAELVRTCVVPELSCRDPVGGATEQVRERGVSRAFGNPKGEGSMAKLQDKIAVITGADSGMGQAMAEEFANEGAHIAVTFHTDDEGAQETRRRVEAAGRRALVRQVDVRDEANVAALFEAVERELGIPDILVNNAGMGSGGAPVAETKTEDFDAVIKTDLYGSICLLPERITERLPSFRPFSKFATQPIKVLIVVPPDQDQVKPWLEWIGQTAGNHSL